MNALYFLFSAVIVVISAAMLLTERLRLWKYLLMMAYIFFISYTASIWGQIMGVPAIAGISFLVMILSKEYKVENACFACIGYLINVTINNLLCLAVVEIPMLTT